MAQSVLTMLGASALLLGAATSVRFVHLEDFAASRRENTRLDDDLLRSPGPEALHVASMEYSHLWAELLWLQIVGELGKPSESGPASWDRVERLSNIAVDLDQKYFSVYHATSIHFIAFARRVEPARKLLLKARDQLPERWEFPFLLGYLEYFLAGDAQAASTWWELATTLPDVPRFVPSLAARSRFHAGDEAGAIALLEEMIESLEGPQRIDAEIRLKLLRSEVKLRNFDAACLKFQAANGRRPKDGAELVEAGFIHDEPLDLLGNPITIEEGCKAKTVELRVREDEARHRVGSELRGFPSAP